MSVYVTEVEVAILHEDFTYEECTWHFQYKSGEGHFDLIHDIRNDVDTFVDRAEWKGEVRRALIINWRFVEELPEDLGGKPDNHWRFE